MYLVRSKYSKCLETGTFCFRSGLRIKETVYPCYAIAHFLTKLYVSILPKTLHYLCALRKIIENETRLDQIFPTVQLARLDCKIRCDLNK